MKNTTSTDIILRNNRKFAIYTCENRGIPAVEDGLKNVQRIALWLIKNRPDKIKTVSLSGLMALEKLYVHGETSAQDAIGKLCAPYRNNISLLKGHGQFGSRTAPVEGIGAPRYTDVQRTKAAESFLYNDIDLVPMTENYDGTNQMPVHFLPLIPTVLLNGVSGIAVGWSTDILPRKFIDIVNATQNALMGKPFKRLVPNFERYDVDVNLLTGNQWEVSGKVTIVDTSTINITELPYGEDFEGFIAKLISMEEKKEISSFIDKSSDRINIIVKFPRGSLGASPAKTEEEVIDGVKYKKKIPAQKAWTEEDAIKFFKLSKKMTERIVVLNWGGNTIHQYDSAEQLIKDFAEWRLKWYFKRFEKLLKDTEYERNYWYVLEALFESKFTNMLGKFKNKSEIEQFVTEVATKKKLTLDDSQMNRVVNLPTYRWTEEFFNDIKLKIVELSKNIDEYKDILSSEDKRRQIYFNELEALKKVKF